MFNVVSLLVLPLGHSIPTRCHLMLLLDCLHERASTFDGLDAALVRGLPYDFQSHPYLGKSVRSHQTCPSLRVGPDRRYGNSIQLSHSADRDRLPRLQSINMAHDSQVMLRPQFSSVLLYISTLQSEILPKMLRVSLAAARSSVGCGNTRPFRSSQ